MAVAENAPRIEPTRAPEVLSFAKGQVAFQARVLAATASTPANRELLNPRNTNTPEITSDMLGDRQTRDYTVIKTASDTERDHYWTTQRSEVAEDARYDTWLEDTKAAFASGQRFFGTRRGENWVALFEKLDIQAVGFADTDAEALYTKYFSEGKEGDNIYDFVRDVIKAHTDEDTQEFDRASFEQNRDAVQWIANLFGEKSAQVMTQIADGETQPRQELADAANQDNRRNNTDDKEYELLEFLYEPQETLQRAVTPTRLGQRRRTTPPPPTPITPIRRQRATPPIIRPVVDVTPPERTDPLTPRPITTITRPRTPIRVTPPPTPLDTTVSVVAPGEPTEPTDETQQPLEENRRYTLSQVFEHIEGDVTENSFFVPHVPELFTLSDEQAEQLVLLEPAFINATPNPAVSPWFGEIGAKGSDPAPRFINGARATRSEIVGLTAAAAENPEQQAHLYRTIAENVLLTHVVNPGLLRSWFRTQAITRPEESKSSLMIMQEIDTSVREQRTGQPDPELHQLLAYDADGEYSAEDTITLWNSRIDDLRTALDLRSPFSRHPNPPLYSHEIAWIDVLAHSVDVNRLITDPYFGIRIAGERQHTPRPLQPRVAEPATPLAPTTDTLAATAPTPIPEAAAAVPRVETPADRFRINLDRLITAGENMTPDEAVIPFTELLQTLPGIQITEDMVRELQDTIQITDDSLSMNLGKETPPRIIQVWYPTSAQPATVSIRIPDSADHIRINLSLDYKSSGDIDRGWIQMTDIGRLGEPTTTLNFDPTGKIDIPGSHGDNITFYGNIAHVDVPTLFRTITDVSKPYTDLNIDQLLENSAASPAPTPDTLAATAPAVSPEVPREPDISQPLEVTNPEQFTQALTTLQNIGQEYISTNYDELPALREKAIPHITSLLEAVPGISVNGAFLEDNVNSMYTLGFDKTSLSVHLSESISAIVTYPTAEAPMQIELQRSEDGSYANIKLVIAANGAIEEGAINMRLLKADMSAAYAELSFNHIGQHKKSMIDPTLGTLKTSHPNLRIPTVLQKLTNTDASMDFYDILPTRQHTPPEIATPPTTDRIEIANPQQLLANVQRVQQIGERFSEEQQRAYQTPSEPNPVLSENVIGPLLATFQAIPGIHIDETTLLENRDAENKLRMLVSDSYFAIELGDNTERELAIIYASDRSPLCIQAVRHEQDHTFTTNLTFADDGTYQGGTIEFAIPNPYRFQRRMLQKLRGSLTFDANGVISTPDMSQLGDFSQLLRKDLNVPDLLHRITNPDMTAHIDIYKLFEATPPPMPDMPDTTTDQINIADKNGARQHMESLKRIRSTRDETFIPVLESLFQVLPGNALDETTLRSANAASQLTISRSGVGMELPNGVQASISYGYLPSRIEPSINLKRYHKSNLTELNLEFSEHMLFEGGHINIRIPNPDREGRSSTVSRRIIFDAKGHVVDTTTSQEEQVAYGLPSKETILDMAHVISMLSDSSKDAASITPEQLFAPATPR